MARPRGFHQARTMPARRQNAWSLGAGGSTVTTLSATGAAFLGSSVIPATEGLTIVRTRGELLMFLSSASAGLDGFTGAFGLAVVTSEAVAAGIASVPTPVEQADWNGWLYHRFFSITAVDALDSGVSDDKDAINAVSAALRIEVDSKAMRKFKVEDRLYAAIEVVEVGTADLRIFFDSRMLVKLP